jgi:hypothetical protein
LLAVDSTPPLLAALGGTAAALLKLSPIDALLAVPALLLPVAPLLLAALLLLLLLSLAVIQHPG